VERSERTLEPGHRLDRYELLCPIAQGGMAAVWLARMHGKHGFEKLVAVKTILSQYANDLRFQQMFLDEARIASGIEHPNVAQILDLGEQGDVLYLVMEWVDGDSLAKLFRTTEKNRVRLPVGIVCRILADTCGGLHAAHELRDKSGALLNVVHRDVSPQNVLVSVKGQAKLIDFGIAKARDRVSGDTSTGLLKGKILYMAPEQALGRPVDRCADVWAVGAVGYHMLSGIPPFEGANQLATLHLLTSHDPPAELPDNVPGPVREVLLRALERDPAKRFPTAESMQKALERAMYGSDVGASASDVASFVATHLADRADQRKKTVELALEAAAQRQRLNAMMQPANPDSASGAGGVLGTRASLRESTPGGQPPLGSGPRLPESPDSVPSLVEVPSSATIASAAVVGPASPIPNRRVAVVGGVLVAAGLLSAMALGIGVSRASSSGSAHVLTRLPATALANALAPKPSATTSTAATPSITPQASASASTKLPAAFLTTKPTATGKATAAPTGTKKVIDDGF